MLEPAHAGSARRRGRYLHGYGLDGIFLLEREHHVPADCLAFEVRREIMRCRRVAYHFQRQPGGTLRVCEVILMFCGRSSRGGACARSGCGGMGGPGWASRGRASVPRELWIHGNTGGVVVASRMPEAGLGASGAPIYECLPACCGLWMWPLLAYRVCSLLP